MILYSNDGNRAILHTNFNVVICGRPTACFGRKINSDYVHELATDKPDTTLKMVTVERKLEKKSYIFVLHEA